MGGEWQRRHDDQGVAALAGLALALALALALTLTTLTPTPTLTIKVWRISQEP